MSSIYILFLPRLRRRILHSLAPFQPPKRCGIVTYQINLIKLHLHLSPIPKVKNHPSSPRHLNLLPLRISLQHIPHSPVEHDLVVGPEEHLFGEVAARGNVCPDGVAEGADFYTYIYQISINSYSDEIGYGCISIYGVIEWEVPSVPTAFLDPIIRVASWVKLETYLSCCDSVSLVW